MRLDDGVYEEYTPRRDESVAAKNQQLQQKREFLGDLNTMSQAITIAQIIISILLIASVLMQQRGGGLSPVFGGGGEGGLYRTRRGLERFIYIATIILTILFLITAVLNILV